MFVTWFLSTRDHAKELTLDMTELREGVHTSLGSEAILHPFRRTDNAQPLDKMAILVDKMTLAAEWNIEYFPGRRAAV